jgi:alpha-1,6-mannosyltransferase
VPAASAGGSGRWIPTALSTAGVAIAAAFWAIAWLELPPGGRGFMAAVAVATTGYVATVALLGRNAAVPRGLLLACLALALGGRAPLVTLPEAWSSDAVRYVWDARVQRAGLNPYDIRPEDEDVDGLHTDLTRRVDAAWLPTIYPPVAQLYFRAVAGIHESVRAFRVAALASDAAIALALLAVLRATGRPAAWVLVYAWHPLPPLEGALGAHLDVAGALLLVLSWWALIRHRTMGAAVLFAAAVLVKPLPLVLAPLYWRRVRIRDAVAAAAASAAVTLWVTRGGLPFGSMGTFIDDFRFNGPVFALLEPALPARVLAAGAVIAGLVVAAAVRWRQPADAPAAWAWPMTAALVAAPVIYPWYLVWIVPFTVGLRAIPVWAWTLSVLAVYPTWHFRRLGGPFAVPDALMILEFAVPAAIVLWIGLRRSWPRAVRGTTHD